MAAIKKELIARFRGDTKGLQDATDKAKKSVNSFKSQTSAASKEIISNFKGIATAAGAMLILREVFSRVQDVIEYGDQVQKLSIRLGASTEALSELRFAAEIAGISFQNLTLAMQRSARRISEAAVGTGEAKEALKELGLSATELNKLRPEQQLERLADAFANTEGDANKLRLAMRLFDTEGVATLQLIGEGSENVRKLREEARSLGLTISTEMAQKFADAKDETARFNAALQGLTTEFTVNVLPVITGLTSSLTNLIKYIKESGTSLLDFVPQLSLYSQYLKLFNDETEKTKKNTKDISNNAGNSNGLIIVDPEAIKEAKKKAESLSNEILRMYRIANDDTLTANMNDAQRAAYEVDVAVRELTLKYGSLTESQIGAIKQIKKMRSETAAITQAQERQKQITDELRQALGGAFEEGILGAKSFGDVLGQLGNQIERILINRVISEPLNAAIGGLVGNVFSGASLGFASGGSFTVAGNSGIDRNTLSLNGAPIANVAKGETIAVSKAGGGGTVVNIYNNSGAGVNTRRSTSGGQENIDIIIDNIVASKITNPASKSYRALNQFSSLEATRR